MKTLIIGTEFPELSTERLVLRQITLDDMEAVYRHFADDEVTRFLDITSLENLEQAEKIIMYMAGMFERREGIRWGISLRNDNRLIGSCGFDRVNRLRGSRGEIKYDLSLDHWGKGVMAEALCEVIRFGFEEMKLHRIEALVVEGGDRSMSLLRKLGFHEEGTLRGHGHWKDRFWDEVSFSMLKHEWEKRKGAE